MRRFLGITLPLLAVSMLAGNVAFAQGRGGGRGGFGFGGPGFGGAGMLLGNPQVQKELKLSDDQVAKVTEIQQAAFAGFGRGGAGGGGGQNLSDEERQKRREEFQKTMEENNKKLLAVLDEGQNARLKQIQLWMGGVAGLVRDEETSKALKLTADQKEALKTIGEESMKKNQEIGAGFRGADEEQRTKLMAQMTEIRKETEAECEAVLTDEQKAQFTKMKGPKFEFDMSAFGRGNRRGGRQGGNNN
jgi:Spy/CpxP family protein refolding chaperone